MICIMKTTSRSLALFIGMACLVSTASAHYLGVKLLHKEGSVSFKPAAAGTYLFRASVDEKASGTFGGKEYQLKRYHATMSFDLPMEQ